MYSVVKWASVIKVTLTTNTELHLCVILQWVDFVCLSDYSNLSGICKLGSSDKGFWALRSWVEVPTNIIETIYCRNRNIFAVLPTTCLLLLLLPIALRPFQFGLSFRYIWCPFLCILNPSGTLYIVSEQLHFSRMGLSAPCPTTSYPGGPIFSVGVVSLSWPVPILNVGNSLFALT